jgi:hypothetical protein
VTRSGGTHDCPGGCHRQVPHRLYSCFDCWGRLPAAIRRDIRAAYDIDHHQHAQAMVRGMCWYRENPLRTEVTS